MPTWLEWYEKETMKRWNSYVESKLATARLVNQISEAKYRAAKNIMERED